MTLTKRFGRFDWVQKGTYLNLGWNNLCYQKSASESEKTLIPKVLSN